MEKDTEMYTPVLTPICVVERLWSSVTVLFYDDGDGDYERYMLRIPTEVVEQMFFGALGGLNPLDLTKEQIAAWSTPQHRFALSVEQAGILSGAMQVLWVSGEQRVRQVRARWAKA